MAKVLIVDDAAFMRLSVRQMLERNGFDVIGEAENGNDAVAMAKELNPDIVTMDITMPEMNGIEAVSRIMAFAPHTKILMVSAMGQELMVREAILAGAKNFLVKPFKEADLIGALKKLQ
jgi:two-component system chemotaxis response regulator CheY